MDYDFSWLGHGMAFTALLGVLAGLLTPFAALATSIWFCLQVYESETVKALRKRRREEKIARLQAKLKILQCRQKDSSSETCP